MLSRAIAGMVEGPKPPPRPSTGRTNPAAVAERPVSLPIGVG